MAISYAKRNPSTKVKLKEAKDINKEHIEVSDNIASFFVDTRYMLLDNESNIWLYAPVSDRFYLYYDKKKNEYTMICYPTCRCKINYECKMGLRLYKEPNVSSGEIKKIPQSEVFEASSHFQIDKDGDIWTYVVLLDDIKRPSKVIDGWVIYKNKRNNFVNFRYCSDTPVVTTNGEIDISKVKRLGSELFLQSKERKYFGKNFLQFFADTKTVTAFNSGTEKRNSARIKNRSLTVKELLGTTYSVAKSGRKISEYHKKSGLRKEDIEIETKDITTRSPKVVLNAYSFPTDEGMKNGVHEYNYEMNYEKDNIYGDIESDSITKELKNDLQKLYHDINYDVRLPEDVYKNMFERYNRFKLVVPDEYLGRGFAHVFFTRPDCNVIDTSNNLIPKLKTNANFDYAFCHRKRLITNLTLTDKKQDFNLFLSNKAEQFSLNDESITTGTVGTNYRKNQVVYGKGNGESKGNGEFTIQYTDNRFLDVIHYHKLWTDYINNVYSGIWMPKNDYLWQKTIDYACSVYYILTAEDGETILFWSKYYGVFPINIPSSSYSWSKGNVITSPELSINYQYTMKEDFNPVSLVEFNLNSGLEDGDAIQYVPTFDPEIGGSGYTWVGTPFIETCKNGTGSNKDYYFKLRFKVPK